jgi:hypothetical protein
MSDKSKSPKQQPKNGRLLSGPKTSARQQPTPTSQNRIVAPTVYRPQPLPKVLQTKTVSHPSPNTAKRTPIAPPVYRPESKKIVQPKIAGVTSLTPKAPPVYRPQPMPKVLQTKKAAVSKHPTTVQGRLLLPHETSRVVQQKESSKVPGGVAIRPAMTPVSVAHPGALRVVQRASRGKGKKAKPKAKPKAKAEAKAVVAPFSWTKKEISEGLADFAQMEEGEDRDSQAARILEKTVPLSKFFGVECNCYGWALGENRFYDPGNTLATWKHRLSGEYTFVDANAADATIILWGVPLKEGKEDEFEVRHASVLLTHAQLRDRERTFTKLMVDAGTYDRIPNPFWSSAMGAGFGIMFHSKDFFENGLFGSAIAGMKKK